MRVAVRGELDLATTRETGDFEDPLDLRWAGDEDERRAAGMSSVIAVQDRSQACGIEELELA